MSEEGKKLELKDEQLAIEQLTEGVIKALEDMSKVIIVLRDNMNKIKLKHIAKSLDCVLEHIGLDAEELLKMKEQYEKDKEAKK